MAKLHKYVSFVCFDYFGLCSQAHSQILDDKFKVKVLKIEIKLCFDIYLL